MLLTTAGVIAPSEIQNAVGRTDIVAFAGDFIYVMELKIAESETCVFRTRGKAAGQIEEKRYMIPYCNKSKTVIPAVVVINAKKKQCIMQEIGRSS